MLEASLRPGARASGWPPVDRTLNRASGWVPTITGARSLGGRRTPTVTSSLRRALVRAERTFGGYACLPLGPASSICWSGN